VTRTPSFVLRRLILRFCYLFIPASIISIVTHPFFGSSPFASPATDLTPAPPKAPFPPATPLRLHRFHLLSLPSPDFFFWGSFLGRRFLTFFNLFFRCSATPLLTPLLFTIWRFPFPFEEVESALGRLSIMFLPLRPPVLLDRATPLFPPSSSPRLATPFSGLFVPLEKGGVPFFAADSLNRLPFFFNSFASFFPPFPHDLDDIFSERLFPTSRGGYPKHSRTQSRFRPSPRRRRHPWKNCLLDEGW